MKKRYTDVDIWKKPWFTDMTPTLKCLVRLIYDQCDMIGVFEPNWRMWSAMIGDDVGPEMLKSIDGGNQFRYLGNGKYLIPDFCEFQYKGLSATNPVHKNYIREVFRQGLEHQPEFADIKEFKELFPEPATGRARAARGPQEEEEEEEKELKGVPGENIFENGELKQAPTIEIPSVKKHLLESNLWRERTLMKLGSRGFRMTKQKFDDWIIQFIQHLMNQLNNERSSLKSYEKWFENWLFGKMQDERNGKFIGVQSEPIPKHLRPNN